MVLPHNFKAPQALLTTALMLAVTGIPMSSSGQHMTQSAMVSSLYGMMVEPAAGLEASDLLDHRLHQMAQPFLDPGQEMLIPTTTEGLPMQDQGPADRLLWSDP